MNSNMEHFLNNARVNHLGVRDGFEEKYPATYLGGGSHRHVYEIEGGKVLKVCEPSAEWANQNEIQAWNTGEKYEKEIPPSVMEMLAPITDHGGGGKWLVMERADVNHPKLIGKTDKQISEMFIKKMKPSGWGIEDPHRENIAILDGRMVTIDYTYLSPIDDMLPKPAVMWEDGPGAP